LPLQKPFAEIQPSGSLQNSKQETIQELRFLFIKTNSKAINKKAPNILHQAGWGKETDELQLPALLVSKHVTYQQPTTESFQLASWKTLANLRKH
jgi:hypothetical protein